MVRVFDETVQRLTSNNNTGECQNALMNGWMRTLEKNTTTTKGHGEAYPPSLTPPSMLPSPHHFTPPLPSPPLPSHPLPPFLLLPPSFLAQAGPDPQPLPLPRTPHVLSTADGLCVFTAASFRLLSILSRASRRAVAVMSVSPDIGSRKGSSPPRWRGLRKSSCLCSTSTWQTSPPTRRWTWVW